MKRPSIQWYPADWRKDAAVQSCSIAARGLWAELLWIMHECEPYGYLVINGRPMATDQLARLVGVSPKECAKLLAELEGNGVLSRDDEGAVYSRRMVRDEAIRDARAAGGKAGSEHGHKGAEHGIKGGRPRTRKGGFETPLTDAEKPPPSSSSSASADLSDERSPPMAPPKPSVASSKRGSRLPEGWALPDDWRAWAETERPGLDIDRTAADFRDYWHARAGPQGVKLDWLATWRLWVRRQADGDRTGGSPPRRGQLTDVERRKLIAGGYAESVARERAAAAWDDG